MLPFDSFVNSSNDIEGKYIAFVDTNNDRHLLQVSNDFQSHLILIGPEGNFANVELELAVKTGFKAVNLGSNTLRTETAGMVAGTILNLI